MKIQIVNKSNNELPKYETELAAGMDLRANIVGVNEKFLFNADVIKENDVITKVIIYPGGRALIPTGLHIALQDKGLEAMVRPRSGLALKQGVTILNTPGCVDSDYTGDIGVIVINFGANAFEINQGDRIAQLVINKIEHIEWEEVEELPETDRGEGGFGSTKVK